MNFNKQKNQENKTYSWDDISINTYYRLKKLFERDDMSEMEKNIIAASIVSGLKAEDIWNMPIEQATVIMNQLAFLDEFKLKKLRKNLTNIVIGDRKYKIMDDVNKLTVAQYTDYQTFAPMKFEYAIDKILSIFIIPEGKEYNQGYDIAETQQYFRENLSFVMAQSLINFLLAKYFNSITHSLKYLVKEMKREKNQAKKKIMEEKINETKEKMQKFLCSIGCVSSNE